MLNNNNNNNESDPENAPNGGGAKTDGRFSDSPVDRRTFVKLSAATAGALTLPGTALADVSGDVATDKYEFVVNHTPDDYRAFTVAEFDSVEALQNFVDTGYAETYREEPTPAAYGQLTTSEAETLLEIEGVEHVDFSPGSNPFWKLDDPYRNGVFPGPEETNDYISYPEMEQALDYLQSQRPDRLNVEQVAHSPGHPNTFKGVDADEKDVYVAEVGKDLDDTRSFQEKEKAVFIAGIHGDERQGVEAGLRIIEDVVNGDADDFDDILDDVVLVYVFINPDGWVVRNPQYPSDLFNFQRGSAGTLRGTDWQLDTNRQYPTIGWIDPLYWAGEPNGAPEEAQKQVPDALGTVEHLRTYDNVNYVCDYHGMHWSDYFVLNLNTNAPFDAAEINELDGVNTRIGEGMEDKWGSVDAIRDDIDRLVEDRGFDIYNPPRNEGGLFNHGTILDTINYQVTGALLGWAGQPEEFGGLGAVTVAPEMSWANTLGNVEKQWRGYMTRHQIAAYRISMREFASQASANTTVDVETGGKDIAYVTTDSLTRSSDDLSHTDSGGHPGNNGRGNGNGNGNGPPAHVEKHVENVRGSTNVGATENTRALTIHAHADSVEDLAHIRVINPGGQVVEEIDPSMYENDNMDCCMSGLDHVFVPNPGAGDWTVEAVTEDGETVDVEIATLESEEEHPDPEAAIGYEQTEYEVTPLKFFKDYGKYLEDGSIESVDVSTVTRGQLLRGNSGKRHYDTVVLIHDDGLENDEYVDALDDFVDAGGNLVLTDTGVNALGQMNVGELDEISPTNVHNETVRFTALANKDHDHVLMQGVRPMQREVWRGSQLGYTTGVDQSVTVVDDDAVAAAGGSTAAHMASNNTSGVGQITVGDAEVNFIGSILPPANQEQLHPFGMANYSPSFLGYLLITNALGAKQNRVADERVIETFGEVR